MSLLGKKIQLVGKSQKGKNRVREQGPMWIVFAETPTVLFSPNEKGPWLFVSPEGKSHDDRSSRWIRAENDKDFIIVA
jgi:hypothetical protein